MNQKKKYLKKKKKIQKISGSLKWKILLKNKTFAESPKSRSVFRTHAGIYDGAFLWIYLTALYFRNVSSIIDLRLAYI